MLTPEDEEQFGKIAHELGCNPIQQTFLTPDDLLRFLGDRPARIFKLDGGFPDTAVAWYDGERGLLGRAGFASGFFVGHESAFASMPNILAQEGVFSQRPNGKQEQEITDGTRKDIEGLTQE